MTSNLHTKWQSFVIAILFLMSMVSCDLLHKKKCEWYLVPEPKHKDYVESGWVSICVRNFKLDRQKCYLKMKLEEAEKVHGKPIRYDSLRLDDASFPRTVVKYELCRP